MEDYINRAIPMKLNYLTTTLSALLLTACSAPLPTPQKGMAWISVETQPSQQMSARRLDNKPVKDGRYFQVQPGKHALELFLSYPKENIQGDGLRKCEVHIRYPDFMADQQYKVKARTNGWSVKAWLYDDAGEKLIESQHIQCGMAG